MQSKNRVVLAIVITMILSVTVTTGVFTGIFMSRLDGTVPRPSSNTGYITDSALLDEVAAHLDDFFFSDATQDDLIYGAAKGMVDSVGDPYTRYFTPDEFTEYMNGTIGKYVGVGLVLSSTEDDELIVVAPYEGSPGAEAGVLPGDIILAVDGNPVNGLMLDDAAKHLRGEHLDDPEGQSVVVTFVRGDGDPFEVTLVREEIDKTTVRAEMMDDGIGYIRISEFDGDTDEEFKEKLEELRAQGMQKMVLDLRDNPGGDFNTSCRIAGEFIEKGEIITYTMNKKEKRQDYKSKGKTIDMPMVVLINGGSASASEVLCGALRDHGCALAIIGTTSFGKGITQSIFYLVNGGGMSITVDKYYTPAGECIHEVGITPDTIVELPEDLNKLSSQLTYEEDLQLQKAVEVLNR